MTTFFVLFAVVALAPLFMGSWRSVLASLGAQALLLAGLVLVESPELDARAQLVVLELVLLRGIFAPAYLAWSVRRSPHAAKIDPIPANLVHWIFALGFLVAAGTFATRTGARGVHEAAHIATFASLFLLGFLVVLSQPTPVGQMLGALVVENGVLLAEELLEARWPILVQLGLAVVFAGSVLVFARFLRILQTTVMIASSVSGAAPDELALPLEEVDVL
jgi:hydrogenase-4 membrane subunit HyfE